MGSETSGSVREFLEKKERAKAWIKENQDTEFVTRTIQLAIGVSYNTARTICLALESEGFTYLCKSKNPQYGCSFNVYKYNTTISMDLLKELNILKEWMKKAKARLPVREFMRAMK